jgi:hypothetical protein
MINHDNATIVFQIWYSLCISPGNVSG